MTRREIERLLKRKAISPKELWESKLLPLGLNSIYGAVARGEIKAKRYGKKILIFTEPLRREIDA